MSGPLDLAAIKARLLSAQRGTFGSGYDVLARGHDVPALIAEVERLHAERQAILDAGGDVLWAGGAKTLPEAVAGVLHCLDVELRRSMSERDKSPAAQVRKALPSVTLTDVELVKRAVENAGRFEYPRARDIHVMVVFGVLPNEARELCRACGLDPDELVGDSGEEE